MKRFFYIYLVFLLFIRIGFCTDNNNISSIKVTKFPFYIYSSQYHHLHYSLSGFAGDILDVKNFRVLEPIFGKSCLKIEYTPVYKLNRVGWVQLYWQYPSNNWADHEEGGFDLSEAKYLFFYSKGEQGNEQIEFKVGGIRGEFGDSSDITTSLISLSKEWTLYMINLEGYDLSNVIGGFGAHIHAHLNPKGITFYLNDIYYSTQAELGENFFMKFARVIRIQKDLAIEQFKNQIVIDVKKSDHTWYDLKKRKMKKSTYKVLDRIAGIIKKQNYKRVIINLRLFDTMNNKVDFEFSNKRAKQIHDYLIKKGVDQKKICYKKIKSVATIEPERKKNFIKKEKMQISVLKWKEGEEENFKGHYTAGEVAYIKEAYKFAIIEWKKALEIDSENDEIKKRIEEAEEKMNNKGSF